MSDPRYISIEEWQLLSFFEVEPTRLDADIRWPYNSFEYCRTAGEITVHFSIMPAYKDFSLIVKRGRMDEIVLSALSVHDIRYHSEREIEWLEIFLTNSDRLELRLKPSFSLRGQLAPQARINMESEH